MLVTPTAGPQRRGDPETKRHSHPFRGSPRTTQVIAAAHSHSHLKDLSTTGRPARTPLTRMRSCSQRIASGVRRRIPASSLLSGRVTASPKRWVRGRLIIRNPRLLTVVTSRGRKRPWFFCAEMEPGLHGQLWRRRLGHHRIEPSDGRPDESQIGSAPPQAQFDLSGQR